MNKKAASRPGDKNATGVEALARALAEKERQLQDLTQQSLGFLEELSEARARAANQAELAKRVEELERALAYARQSVRHAGGSAPSATPPETPTGSCILEVVCWGAGSATREVLETARHAGVPVTWIGPAASVPPSLRKEAGIRWVAHRDARTPAQCWNLGMASTQASQVLFLGPGASLAKSCSPPQGTDEPNVVISCPATLHGNDATQGYVEADERFGTRPLPAAAGDDPAREVAFPSSHAFVLRRAAFECIGMFHEGLTSTAAMFEYVLRARQRSFAVVTAPGLEVRVGADLASRDTPLEAERLALLAQLRPAQLGPALGESEHLWARDPAEVAERLRALIAQLGDQAGPESLRDILSRVATGMVQRAQPTRLVVHRVHAIRTELLRALASEQGTPEADSARTSLQRAEFNQPSDATAAFVALADDIAMLLRGRGAMAARIRELESQLLRLQSETQTRASEISSLRNEQDRVARAWQAARGEDARQLESLRQQLASAAARADLVGNLQMQLEEQRNLRAMAEQRLAATGQRLADVESLHAQAERARAAGQDQLERATSDLVRQSQKLADAQQMVQKLESMLQGMEQSARMVADETRLAVAAMEARLKAADADIERQRQAGAATAAELREARQESDALRGDLRTASEALGAARSDLMALASSIGLAEPPPIARFAEILSLLLQDAQALATTLAATSTTSAAALAGAHEGAHRELDRIRGELAEMRSVLAEREKWITILLDEVTRRRILPRKLFPHEQSFLRDHQP